MQVTTNSSGWRCLLLMSFSFRITEYTSDLSRSQVDTIIAEAFKLYSDVIPLDFTQMYSGTADIMILFKARSEFCSSPIYILYCLYTVYSI